MIYDFIVDRDKNMEWMTPLAAHMWVVDGDNVLNRNGGLLLY